MSKFNRVIADTDWKLLRQQKLALYKHIQENQGEQIESLQGILHFIDAVMDAAAEVMGEKTIFGDLNKNEGDNG